MFDKKYSIFILGEDPTVSYSNYLADTACNNSNLSNHSNEWPSKSNAYTKIYFLLTSPFCTWTVHKITLCALHSSSQSRAVKSTIRWRGIGTGSTPYYEPRTTRMRAGRPFAPFCVVTVNCG